MDTEKALRVGTFRSLGSVPRGRLLSEFLVSLGLFFLILTADLAILDSASGSTSQSKATREALSLAEAGLEELIASSDAGRPYFNERSFASKGDTLEGFSYTRTLKVTPLGGDRLGVSQASVVVEWGQSRRVKLERYVAKL